MSTYLFVYLQTYMYICICILYKIGIILYKGKRRSDGDASRNVLRVEFLFVEYLFNI